MACLGVVGVGGESARTSFRPSDVTSLARVRFRHPPLCDRKGCRVRDMLKTQLGLFSRNPRSAVCFETAKSKEKSDIGACRHCLFVVSSTREASFAPFRCVTHAEIVISVVSGSGLHFLPVFPSPPSLLPSPMHKRNSRMDKQEVYGGRAGHVIRLR